MRAIRLKYEQGVAALRQSVLRRSRPVSGRIKPLGTVRDDVSFRTATARCYVCKNYWNVDLSYCRMDTKLADIEPQLVCLVCANRKFNVFTESREFAYPYLDDGHTRMRPNVSFTKRMVEASLQPAPTGRHPMPDASTTELLAELKYRGFISVDASRVRQYDVLKLYELAKGKSQTVNVIMPDRK